MAKTEIEWTDYTFNPWEGCQKVSPGCANCYAEARDAWLHRGAHWGPGSVRLEHGKAYWKMPLQWQRQAAKGGYHARVFCGSLCDILEAGSHLDALRARVFSLVPQTPNLIWLFLTKRPENALEFFPEEWLEEWPSNAMLGFTTENQEWLEKRWGYWNAFQSRVPGLRTFISAEPLLGPLAFGAGLVAGRIDWVIAGGESGDKARPMHPDWLRSVRDQCQAAGVPFLFKQWGEWVDYFNLPTRAWKDSVQTVTMQVNGLQLSGIETGWASSSRALGCVPMYRVGKPAAGRLLNDLEHNELPGYWPASVGLPQRDAAAQALGV